jgi:copper chaperone NosL
MQGWIRRVTAFFQGQLSPLSRVLIVAATLSILPGIVLPTWRITLHAPQYPQGLTLVIYPNTVSGDLSEVNLLNHYIGMQEIVPDEFPEFRFIPFFILRFFGFALLTALIGRMPIAALGWMDFVLFGTVMLYTFRHWLYEYGHNLSPDAPLKIQPFTPALLGTTHVGQFTVTSTPALGAILMAVAGLIGPAIAIYEWRRYVRASEKSPPADPV